MGLNINVRKTKFMVFRREHQENAQLILNNFVIESVHRFKYLSSITTKKLDPDIEIKCRIETAREIFCSSINLLLQYLLRLCKHYPGQIDTISVLILNSGVLSDQL